MKIKIQNRDEMRSALAKLTRDQLNDVISKNYLDIEVTDSKPKETLIDEIVSIFIFRKQWSEQSDQDYSLEL